MKQLSTINRIELEIEVRKAAINIARFGFAGIELFCQQFPNIAKECVQSSEEENANLAFPTEA